MTRIDLAAADAALQKMHTSVLTTEQQREEERLALNQSLGFSDEQPVPLEQNIEPPSPKSIPAAAQFIEGIEKRRSRPARARVWLSRAGTAVKSGNPPTVPEDQYRLLTGGDNTNVITTGFGVTIDLPLFDRNQGAIAVEDGHAS